MSTLKAPPRLNLVEWADQYRYLSSESSSSPGRWRTSNVPAARGPMLAVTDPNVKKITVMACTQLLKTELINNIVGYFAHQDPSPIIVMQPTGKMAEAWSKDRLDKMIRDTPVLNKIIASKKTRDSDNTILHKGFPGGHITIVSAGSSSDLAMRPVRIVLCDEVDEYDKSPGDNGDPIKRLQERSATFWNKLHVNVCSPTIKGSSRIEKEYLAGDRRIHMVPCPHCGEANEMKWENVRWQNRDPKTAAYMCPSCTVLWTEEERIQAIQHGYDVATAPFNGHASFRFNKLVSPWEPLSVLVEKWLESFADQEMLKTFLNTQLAETYEEKGESPEHMRLYERRSLYDINTLPKGVMFLTAGCDVQKDRLEVEIVGWGRDKRSWSIDYRVIMGETSTEAPWKELSKLLDETWVRHDGMQVALKVLAVDSGYNTQHVYNWARKFPANRVMVVKGQDNLHNLLGIPQAADVSHSGTRVKRGVRVWPVGVSTAKSELYGWLNLNGAGDDGVYPPGYCFFPQYGEEYFRMLTAEQLVKRQVNRKTVFVWVKSYERNEALDCRNYARAAAAMVGIDRFKEEDWLNLDGPQYIAPRKVNATPTAIVRDSNSAPKGSSYWGSPNRRKSIW